MAAQPARRYKPKYNAAQSRHDNEHYALVVLARPGRVFFLAVLFPAPANGPSGAVRGAVRRVVLPRRRSIVVSGFGGGF